MKIAFIRPSMFGCPSSDAMMPLIFAIVKSITPKTHQLSCYDERLQTLPDRIDADIVAISVETFAAKRAYELADQYRREGKTVLLGGFHPTMLPAESKVHADAVLTGDLEPVWHNVIWDFEHHELKERYDGGCQADLSQNTYDYSVFEGMSYRLIGVVQFCRGCRYQCDFCSIHAFYGDSVRLRPINDVVNDICHIRKKYLFFTDDNIFSDKEMALQLFDALQPLRKKWICQISMDVARDKEILRHMRKSGCIMVIIGFESLNKENLRKMGKSANLAWNDYETVIDNIYEAGLMIYGTFIVGYDGDTRETAHLLMQFALRHHFAVANFNPLMPMPGTPLYDRLRQEKALPYPEWWIDEDFRYGQAMVIPKLMTQQELLISCRQARYEYNSPRCLLRRLCHKRANARTLSNFVICLAAGVVSRREIHFKQERKLGGQHEDNADKTKYRKKGI